MEEKELEVQQQVAEQTEVQTQTVNTEESVEVVSTPKIDESFKIQDFRKSEMEFKTKTNIQGVTEVNSEFMTEAQEFAQKKDVKKLKSGLRAKVIKGVYFTALSLLLVLVGVNAITLAVLSGTANKNAETIKSKQETVNEYVLGEGELPEPLPITLNEPRDYNDDNKELTFWDKVTILFRNIFS